jgi:hypothetical protein
MTAGGLERRAENDHVHRDQHTASINHANSPQIVAAGARETDLSRHNRNWDVPGMLIMLHCCAQTRHQIGCCEQHAVTFKAPAM